MKYIKVLLSCMIILLAMLTSSEIYQNYLSVFIEDFYCVTYYPQEGITQEKMICDIFEKAREHQLDIFYAEDVIVNWHQETIDLYGDERTQKTLSSQYDILYGQRNSLLTGSCEVRYHNYQQLSKKELAKEPTYYLIGKYKDMVHYKQELSDTYAGAFPKQDGSRNHHLMQCQLAFVWIMTMLVLGSFTLYESLLRKKENFLRISLGERISVIVLKNIVIDILVYLAAYFLSYVVVRQMTQTASPIPMQREFFLLLCIGNSFIYCNMFFYNVRKVLSGDRVSRTVLYANYVIKTITNVAAILLLSANIVQLYDCAKYYEQRSFYQQYRDYCYVHFLTDEDSESLERNFYETYKDQASIISIGKDLYLNESEKSGVIVANKNACSYLERCIPDFEYKNMGQSNFILLPEQSSLSSDDINYLKGLLQDESTKIVTYKSPVKVIAQNVRRSEQSEWVKNPVIVCQMQEKGSNTLWNFDELLIRIDQKQMKEFSARENYEDAYVLENVWENYTYHWNQKKRTVLLNVVMLLIVCGFQCLINIAIVRMEFQVNAIQLAIQKILGYSVWQRNRKMIGITLAIYVMSVLAGIVLAWWYPLPKIAFLLLGNGILFVLDLITILFFIWRQEKLQLVKILKGGSL